MKAERVTSKKTGRPGWLFRFKDPYTGRRTKRRFWYSEELLAQKALHRFLEDRQRVADNLPASNGRRLPYAALVAKFLNEAHLSTAARRDDLKRLLERNPLKLKSAAELFDQGRLSAACRHLHESVGKGGGFRSVQAPLKQLTNWAESAGLFEKDPLRSWKRLPCFKKGKGARGLCVDDVRLILQALAELDDVFRRKFCSLVPVLALLLTGNRNSAVFASRVGDLRDDRIALPDGNGKKRNGSATIPAAFVEILRQYLEHRSAKKADVSLLVSWAGTKIDITNVLKDFKRAVILAAVRRYWPANPEYAGVEPVAVAYRLHVGTIRRHDGAPPKDPEKLEARRRRDALIEAVAREIESDVRNWCERKTLYSLRKTHITWARQLVSIDAVRVQVGHAPRPEDNDVEVGHYVEDSLLNPALSSSAVWDVLLGRMTLDKKTHEACFEVTWRDGRVCVGPIPSGPIEAPEGKTAKTTVKKVTFLHRQSVATARVEGKPSLGLEPRTYALRKQ